nr:MAG TPA: putative excisionase [Caudoviricetes sp.]
MEREKLNAKQASERIGCSASRVKAKMLKGDWKIGICMKVNKNHTYIIYSDLLEERIRNGELK